MFPKIFLFSALLLCLSCSKTAQDENKKPLVLASVAPYQFLAQEIAGEVLDVQTVVPQGANPHSYEPTSSQVREMARGRVWLQIGEPFEEKIARILKDRVVFEDLREGIPLIEEAHSLACSHCSMDHLDRHVWLSPKLAALQAEKIAGVLGREFPETKEVFDRNLARLKDNLEALDLEISIILEPVKDRAILVSHPAFGYFCRDYHFEQLSVEYEGKDPRPRHLEEILKRAMAEHAELALALPQYNNKGAQLIAEKLRVPVHYIDPYSADYFTTMRKLAHLIADPRGEYASH